MSKALLTRQRALPPITEFNGGAHKLFKDAEVTAERSSASSVGICLPALPKARFALRSEYRIIGRIPVVSTNSTGGRDLYLFRKPRTYASSATIRTKIAARHSAS